jgi:hypothetical protein
MMASYADGTVGTAHDGTPVKFSTAIGRFVPAATWKAFEPNAGAKSPTSEADVADVKEANDEADRSRILASRSKQFMDVMGDTPTGPAYASSMLDLGPVHIGNPIRTAINMFNKPLAAKLNELDNINAATWAKLREKGAGAVRGFEATGPAGWQQAFPSTANWGPANQAAAKRFANEQAENTRRAAFVQGYVNSGRGGSAQAEQAYDAMPSGTDPTHLAGWSQQLPDAQRRAAQLYAGSTAPPGSPKNPFVPRNAAEAHWIAQNHPGASVLDTDGRVITAPGARPMPGAAAPRRGQPMDLTGSLLNGPDPTNPQLVFN